MMSNSIKLDTGQSTFQTPQLSPEQKSSSSKTISSKRISVILTDDAEKMLEALANTQGISKSEALRKAIATEAYFVEEKQKGSKVFVRRKDDSLMEVVFR